MLKKGLLALGDITPKTKSNLLETFVSNRCSIFFSSKTAKKTFWTWQHGWLFLHSMSLKHALLRYNAFKLLHQTLSKRILKKIKLSRNYPKNKQKNLPWKLRNLKTCLKWRTWGVKNKNFKKNKRALGSGRYYSKNQE